VILKTPICTFDAKTGILCDVCENKLESGQITPSDVNGSMILAKLAQSNPEIDKMTLFGSKEIENEVILIFKSSDVRAIRSDKKLFDLIQQSFKKNVWIVESDSNDRRFLENLFYPVGIDNINFIWLPDGKKLTRVLIDIKKIKNVKEKTLESIKKISLSIRKIELIVETEA
jgi:transcription antitermination factor NusA-like protein